MSREKKWTPGPWELREHPHDEDFFVEAKNHGYEMPYDLDVCGEDYNGFGDEEVRLANYSLISAAPELVSELEEADATICVMCKLLNPQHKDCTSCPEREDRLAALAKAYGEVTP